jgi:hypothetical protein
MYYGEIEPVEAAITTSTGSIITLFRALRGICDFSASLSPQFRYSRLSIRSKRPFTFKTQFRT